MRAEAYRYAESGTHPPDELVELSYIDRFGAEAVLGRPVLSAGEIFRMTVAENIKNALHSRKESQNWAEWAGKNPAAAKLLADIEKQINAN